MVTCLPSEKMPDQHGSHPGGVRGVSTASASDSHSTGSAGGREVNAPVLVPREVLPNPLRCDAALQAGRASGVLLEEVEPVYEEVVSL